MKLLGAVVNIDQQKIVQQQILEEITAVKLLLVSDDQILDLTDCDPGNHKCVLRASLCSENELQFFIVHDLEIVAVTDDLRVHG